MTDSPSSLGDERTQAGLPPEPSVARSLGDQSTHAEGMSSVSELGVLAANLDETLELTDLAARYELGEVIGRGGMGEVLLARDKRLERSVAIKRILGEGARSATALRRFLTEARSLAQLNHFNIVQVYDYGRDREGPFLILEFVPGKSLHERLREGPLSTEQAVDLACQLCDGLGAAHERGIIHRDVKPANVLLTKRGEPKLTDFGLAHRETSDHERTQAGAVLGTIDFMPPEQRRDSTQADARSDLWSLAATLYQLMTGESPRVIDLDAVPQHLRQTLAKALKSNKDERYQTAREFQDALRTVQRSTALATSLAVDLRTGECPKCRTNNEVNRKFCRQCANPLRVSCLKCRAEIPIWEEVCGECGAKQSDLAEQRRTEMVGRQEQAMELLRKHEFAKAAELAMLLRDEPNPRFQYLKGWAEQFLQDIERARVQQQERISSLVKEAIRHEESYDYRAAVLTLEQVSESLRGMSLPELPSGFLNLLTRVQQKRDTSQHLNQLIRQRVELKQLNGLLSEVESLLRLRPDRQDVAKLREQLVARERKQNEIRAKANAEATRQFQSIPNATQPSLEMPVAIPPMQPSPAGTQRAREMLRRPAIWLIVPSVLNIAIYGLVLLSAYLSEKDWNAGAVFSVLLLVTGIAMNLVVIAGGINMLRIKNYSLGMVGVAIALLPIQPFMVISIPCAIWALVRLCRTDIRECFR